MSTLVDAYSKRNTVLTKTPQKNLKVAPNEHFSQYLTPKTYEAFSSLDKKPLGSTTIASTGGCSMCQEGFDSTFTDMQTNSDNISTSLQAHGKLTQSIDPLLPTDSTVHDALSEDAKNLIFQQNTIYVVGTIASATLLITALIIGANR